MNQEQFEQIEAYLIDAMPPEEKSAFEALLKGDEKLRHELNMQKENMLAVEMGAFAEAVKSQGKLYAIKNSSSNSGSWFKFNSTNLFAIAASIALIIAIGFFWNSKDSSNQEIFASYVTIDPGLPVTMGSTDNYEFNRAMVDYKSGDYESAIEKWENLLSAHSNSDTLSYFLSVARFNKGDFETCTAGFQAISEMDDSAYSDKAQWYLVLCYLQSEELEKIKAISPNSSSPFSKRIAEIQKLISS